MTRNVLTKIKSLLRRVVSKSRRLSTLDQPVKIGRFSANVEWYYLISRVNCQLLSNPQAKELKVLQKNRKRKPGALPENTWKIALSTLAAEWSHRLYNTPEDLAALQVYFNHILDENGRWITPINRVEYAMQGYAALYLARATGNPRYQQAAHLLAEELTVTHPQDEQGCLPYDTNTNAILVDSLAMICPFLARYANQYGNKSAAYVATNQLKQFILNSIDEDTSLPFHGYLAGGPKRLGLLGWGRGTGWYMLGLIDTLLELPADHPDYNVLLKAYSSTAKTLKNFQRKDGHWNWVILHAKDTPDSSTTSLIGYALLRGIEAGLLGGTYCPVIDSAINALVKVTRANGILDGSLAECRGLGKYPQNYQPTLWLQGSATAFAALYFARSSALTL